MDCSRSFPTGENARVVVWALLILMIAGTTVGCGGGEHDLHAEQRHRHGYGVDQRSA